MHLFSDLDQFFLLRMLVYITGDLLCEVNSNRKYKKMVNLGSSFNACYCSSTEWMSKSGAGWG